MHSDCVYAAGTVQTLKEVGKDAPAGDKATSILAGVDGCLGTLDLIRAGSFDQSSNQPIPDFGVLAADYIEKKLKGEAVEPGEIDEGRRPLVAGPHREGRCRPAAVPRHDVGRQVQCRLTSGSGATSRRRWAARIAALVRTQSGRGAPSGRRVLGSQHADRLGEQPWMTRPATPVVEMLDIVKDFPGVRALDDVSFSVAAGRGACARRQERCRQVDADACADRALRARLRHDPHPRHALRQAHHRAGQGGRHRHRLAARQISCRACRSPRTSSPAPCPSTAAASSTGRACTARRPNGCSASASTSTSRGGWRTRRVAERQMIEIARALFADASVVILDEPTAPLPKHDVARLFDFVRRQREQGASFIYISHYLEEIFEVADRVTVMRNGRVIGHAPIGDITQPELIRLISGANVERYRARARHAPASPCSRLQDLTRPAITRRRHHSSRRRSRRPDRARRQRAGRAGARPVRAGGAGRRARSRIDGKPYAAGSPDRGAAPAPRLSAARPARPRHHRHRASVRTTSRSRCSGQAADRARAHRRAARSVRSSQDYIDAPRHQDAVACRRTSRTLSGGNQQKVVVAKLAATEPRVLFLDEPTQGVDVQAKVEILRIVDELSKRGVAVGVVSDELSELMDICDRIVVFYRGRIVREFRKGQDDDHDRQTSRRDRGRDRGDACNEVATTCRSCSTT